MAKTVLPLTVFMMHFSVAAAVALRHNEFVHLDVETPAWHRYGIRVIHRRRRARLEDERPQLGEVPTTVVKIRKTVPAKDSLLTRYRPPDKARRLARNLAQSPPASVQAVAEEISSARYRSAGSLWIA